RHGAGATPIKALEHADGTVGDRDDGKLRREIAARELDRKHPAIRRPGAGPQPMYLIVTEKDTRLAALARDHTQFVEVFFVPPAIRNLTRVGRDHGRLRGSIVPGVVVGQLLLLAGGQVANGEVAGRPVRE